MYLYIVHSFYSFLHYCEWNGRIPLIVKIIISYFYFTVLETIPLLYLHTHKQ